MYVPSCVIRFNVSPISRMQSFMRWDFDNAWLVHWLWCGYTLSMLSKLFQMTLINGYLQRYIYTQGRVDVGDEWDYAIGVIVREISFQRRAAEKRGPGNWTEKSRPWGICIIIEWMLSSIFRDSNKTYNSYYHGSDGRTLWNKGYRTLRTCLTEFC